MPTEQLQDETTATVTNDSPPPRLGAKIIRNAMFGGLRYVLVAPIPFLMTPLILHKIGVAGYGTWAVFLAINGLTSLADLGLVGTLSKFVAEYYARHDMAALSRLLNSGLSMFLLLDFVIAAVLWGASPLLAGRLFRGSTVPNVELVFLLRFFLVVVAANILTQLFASVTTGLQRLDYTNTACAANIVMSAMFSAVLLLRGWGLRGLVCGYVGSAVLTVVTYVILIRKLLPQLKLNPLRFDRIEAKKMFGFSLRLYLTQAAVAVHNQVEKVFLGMLVGVGPVGWYGIASDVALKVRGALGFILEPVLPAASELDALGDESRIMELYYRTHKYLAFLGVPLVCYVVAISHRFVELWVGSDLRVIALPLSILLVVNFFNLATGPGFLIFAGRGYLTPGIQSAALAIVLNMFLSFGLIYKFGFPGAVVGTAVSLILASAYFVLVFHRHTRYPFGRLLRESYLKPTLCSISALAILLALGPATDLSWFGLAAAGVVFGTLYFIGILISGFFDAYDRGKIKSLVPSLRYARKGSIA